MNLPIYLGTLASAGFIMLTPLRAQEGPLPGEPSPAALQAILLNEDATIVDCYDASKAYLEKICEDYRRIRAAELAKKRDIAFQEAYANVQSVMPVLEPIDRKILLKRITDPDEITAHKMAVEKVETEVSNMVELALRLLQEIEERQEPPPVEVEVAVEQSTDHATGSDSLVETKETQENEQEQAQAAGSNATVETETLQAELEQKARESAEHRAVDVSQEMRAVMSAPITQSREALQGASLTTQQMQNLKITLDQVGYSRTVATVGGEEMQWMFVDTWYTIGPFPNPSRININTKFPPETVVNLSATYPGKGGRMVGWEFLQGVDRPGRPMMSPHHAEDYAIYYGYTELWFEEDADLWIAIGSDDKANVWVNDLPVWISGDQLKSWRIDEGFRKVFFKKGLNRILYRVENGWHTMGFSLGIQVQKPE